MSRTGLRVLVAGVAAAIAVGVLAASASAAAPVVPPSTYLRDVTAGATSLQRFGIVLDNASDVPELRARSARARTYLRQFDRRVYVLGRYRLRSRVLNRQRARLARTGPPVTAILSRFLDAALTDDLALVQRLLPTVRRRIGAFERAASG